MLSLNTPEQLFDKVKYSNAILIATYENPQYDYYLFDTIFSLNHLFEWYLKDKDKSIESKYACINKFNPFQTPYDVSSDFKELYKKLIVFPSFNSYQLSIRLLCNKGKHFKNNELEKTTNIYTAVAGHQTMVCGGQYARCGRYMQKYLIDIEGNDVNIENIIKTLMDDWGNFLLTTAST